MSSSIRLKVGKCVDCEVGSSDRPLTAGRCSSHYWAHRKKVASEKPKFKHKPPVVDKRERILTLGRWFNEQINQMPDYCENEDCRERLIPWARWSMRAYVAHVVPKRHFETVMVHEHNRMFLCIDCHTNYDNWLSQDVQKKMPFVFSLACERFRLFKHLISPAEVQYLRPFLRDIFDVEI
jgi:hypothetical protein